MMPAGDRTGPEGMGPMTGRGAGVCAGNVVPGYGAGAGFGFGRGRGRGFGRGFGRVGNWAPVAPSYTAPTREQQLDSLKAQSAGLESQLNMLKEQIGQLESE